MVGLLKSYQHLQSTQSEREAGACGNCNDKVNVLLDPEAFLAEVNKATERVLAKSTDLPDLTKVTKDDLLSKRKTMGLAPWL